ncbi:MAG TPA: AI-2E family transporter, partial [Kribbella sp.]|nr:AI-2E family transporter [Kribbella sp.]
MSESGRDDAEAPAAGEDHPSPVADNEVMEESSVRPARAAEPAEPVDAGVTHGMHIASAWAWRFLVVVAAIVVIGYGLRYFSEVVVPVTVGVLLTALLIPVTNGLQRLRLPRGAAAGITVLATIVVVAGLLTLVGTQIAGQFDSLSTQVGEGVQKLRELGRINFGLTDADVTNAIDSLREQVTSGGAIGQRAAAVGTTATHVVAGLFIALFCLFFFLYQG